MADGQRNPSMYGMVPKRLFDAMYSAPTFANNDNPFVTQADLDAAIGDNNALNEILANGNSTGTFDILISAGQKLAGVDELKLAAASSIIMEADEISVLSGTPTGTVAANSFNMYSADIVAGNAAPHFKTEAGNIIKLYSETTAIVAAAFVVGAGTAVNDASTFGGYTLGKVVAALKAQGLLA